MFQKSRNIEVIFVHIPEYQPKLLRFYSADTLFDISFAGCIGNTNKNHSSGAETDTRNDSNILLIEKFSTIKTGFRNIKKKIGSTLWLNIGKLWYLIDATRKRIEKDYSKQVKWPKMILVLAADDRASQAL